jgi:dTDP-4-dehydrorhamnose reductase
MAGPVKLLILGANGQVGHAAQRQAGAFLQDDLAELHAFGRDQVDLADPDQLADALRSLRPDVVVNAAAYTNVEKAEDEPALAGRVNAQAVGELAELCRHQGARLIHYSTDYVFDGAAREPYTEDAALAPQSSYGRSKAAGERYLQEVGGNYLIFRTGWVFGLHGENFYRKILRFARAKAATQQALTVVDDQTGAPTPAEWLAELALSSVRRRAHGTDDYTGLLHAAASGSTTWHDYAELALDLAAGTPLLPQRPDLQRVKTAAMNFKATRPAYSVLDTGRLSDWLGSEGPAIPQWRDAVRHAVEHDMRQPPSTSALT